MAVNIAYKSSGREAGGPQSATNRLRSQDRSGRSPGRWARSRGDLLRAALLVGPDGTWFEISGRRIELGRRKILTRLLEALVVARLQRPGAAIPQPELFAAGWPGEHIDPASACNRTYVAINTLRKQGLRDVLLTTEGGYLLDPGVHVRRADESGCCALPLSAVG